MGLDTSWYRGLTRAAEGTDEMDTLDVWNHRDFPGREAPLAEGEYTYEECGDGPSAAYSGYNRWRNELAQLADYPAVGGRYDQGAWESKDGPFIELINFSDCEGVIGTTACIELAKDFAQYQSKADAIGGYFLSVYNSFRNAFEKASDRGAVRFC